MKKLVHFLREYRQFSWVAVASIAALGLEAGGQHVPAHWLLGLAAVAAMVPVTWSMVQDLRVGKYGVDILAVTATLVSVLMHQYWAGMVIVLMLTGGEALEDYAGRRAKKELNALLARAPQKAHVLRGRKTLDLPVREVRVGDKLFVKAGETVPTDAVILEGDASLDESSLTGESLPQVKTPGDLLLSGSINLDGVLTVQATQIAADSQYEQIIKLVRAARNSQAPFVRLADSYAIPFTLLSFTIALAAWFLSHQSIRFLEVLVVATPCPLILAAPIAIISGMSRSAKHGIIMKTGAALEKLAAARTFAFDKTGTLTEGQLQIESVKTFHQFKADEVLRAAASLERGSSHIIAQAIIAQAEKKQLRAGKPRHITEFAGRGLEALVSGKHVVVGRLGLLQDRNITVPAAFNPRRVQQTAALVAIDGKLAGIISFNDQVRAESKPTLQKLTALGIKNFLMMTGDNRTAAQLVARKLGIKNVQAEALPGDKLRALEAINERPVVFVGDGVNDAPVLTAADVGIALGARGSTAASESADVVIMLDDLSHVAEAVEIAKRTFYIARQSIWVGIALSVVLMLIVSTGHFRPLYGAIIQEAVDVIVIFNALRAHGTKKT